MSQAVNEVETYPYIDRGELVEAGAARLASVTCRSDAVSTDALGSDTFEYELNVELYRSRRYQRPVVLASLSRLSLNGHGATARMELTERLRAIDHVWEVDDRIYLLLPETDRDGAEQLIARIAAEEPELLPRHHVMLAAFPDDALTSVALIAAVKRDAEGEGVAAAADRIPSRLLRGARRRV